MINRLFEEDASSGRGHGTLLRPPAPVEREEEEPFRRFSAGRVAPSRPERQRRAPRSRPWLGDLLAVLFLVAVAVALTWPLARHPASALPDLGDPVDSAWRLSWPLQQALRDPRHLLDANTAYPFDDTYLFDELILGVAIVVAPVWYLTHNAILLVNAALLVAFAGNGLAMYLLGRHLTGNRAAAVAAALVFAVAPFRFAHLGHVGLSTAFWLPLALYFLDRMILGGRWRDALLFGICCAMQALSAQYYGFQMAIVVGLYLLWTAVRRGRWLFNTRTLIQLAAAVVLAETIILPIVVPYVGVKEMWGYSRGLDENELHSATLSSFLGVPPENVVGGRVAAALRGALGVREWNIWLYPGLGATALALVGVARRRKWWSPPNSPPAEEDAPPDAYSFCLALAALAAALCLGPTLHLQRVVQGGGATRLMPYRLIFNVVPYFDAMRAPERFGNVFLLGLAGAAGFGAAAILRELAPTASGRAFERPLQVATRVVAALLLVAVVGAEYLHRPLTLTPVPPVPPIYGWLATQPPGPLLELPMTIPANQPNREQLRQYWSTFNWLPRVNASSDIAPRAYGALRNELAAFPDARTIPLLQGLGVRYILIHRDGYTPAEWDALTARLGAQRAILTQREGRGGDIVYELAPDDRLARLQGQIPAGASIYLSDADPADIDTYMAMVGWRLQANHTLITKIIPTFGQRHVRPEADTRADWVVVYRNETPAQHGYPANLPLVYEDGIVRVYQNARPATGQAAGTP